MNNEPYLPSTEDELIAFLEQWCEQCAKRAISPDAKHQCYYEGVGCSGEVNNRWFIIDGVPTCTAFKDRKNRKRCPKKVTVDENQGQLFSDGGD